MRRISDGDLQLLIDGLTEYKKDGVIDPWLLGDGRIIEPLDVLLELQELRSQS